MWIEVKNLSCSYGSGTASAQEALKDVSFKIEDGEFVGIMGRTGCGKSTLIQLIAGLLTPDRGQVLIDGEDINAPGYDRLALRGKVGIVFQYPEYQLFETTVEKDVAFVLKHSGLGKDERERRVKEALEAMGFSWEAVRKKSPLSLSGGEKRRVAIAGVLAAQPRILIFDEPIAGLDPFGRTAFLELSAKLNRQGTTILMVSHNADALCEYAGRILMLDQGRLTGDGTPETLFGGPEAIAGAGQVCGIARRLYERGILPSPAVTKYQTLVEEIRRYVKEGERL